MGRASESDVHFFSCSKQAIHRKRMRKTTKSKHSFGLVWLSRSLGPLPL